MSDDLNLLPALSSRQDVFDYLDGHSVKTVEGFDERHLTGGVVKSLMLETVPGSVDMPPMGTVLGLNGMAIEWLDDDLGLVSSPSVGTKPFAVLDNVSPRHPILHTLLKATEANPVLNSLVTTNPWLDRLWISAPMFEQMWKRVVLVSPPNRYTRLKFDHEAFFEVSDQDPDLASEFDTDGEAEESSTPDDRRASSFTLVDRVSTIQQKLPTLQEAYRPLESLVQLRIPSTGRGGHDFYFDGRVTNRSDSFFDHRANIKVVVDMYRRATDASEKALWLDTDDVRGAPFRGSALTIRFSEPLGEQTFERWLDSTFSRHGRFRLSGRVFRTGPTNAQIAALDRHLWQTLQMEVSARGITALLPRGTCGNTVHRLITNIQRYLDPGVDAWVGETKYDDLVSTSATVAA
jgi:hypothetical protein